MTIQVRYRERAQYDLETARVLMTARRYAAVLYCCHEAVHFALASVVIEINPKLPPRRRGLVALANAAGLTPDAAQTDDLRTLTTCDMALYPRAAGGLRDVNRKFADECLQKAENALRWVAATSGSS